MKHTASRGRVSAATGVSRTMPARRLAAAEVHAQFLPLAQDVFLAEEAHVAEQFLAVGVVEDLRGNHLDAVLLAGVGILPHVNELTCIRPAYSFFNSSRMGAIILHGMHLPAPRSTSLGSLAPVVGAAAAASEPALAAGTLAALRRSFVAVRRALCPSSGPQRQRRPRPRRATIRIFTGVFMRCRFVVQWFQIRFTV